MHVQSIQLGRKPTDLEIANEVKAMRRRERKETLLTKKWKATKAGDRGDRGDRERMKRLEELCAAQDERLKKVEEMLTQLHVKVVLTPSYVPLAPKQKGTKRRSADKETEQAVDTATETEEASNASAELEDAPEDAQS